MISSSFRSCCVEASVHVSPSGVICASSVLCVMRWHAQRIMSVVQHWRSPALSLAGDGCVFGFAICAEVVGWFQPQSLEALVTRQGTHFVAHLRSFHVTHCHIDVDPVTHPRNMQRGCCQRSTPERRWAVSGIRVGAFGLSVEGSVVDTMECFHMARALCTALPGTPSVRGPRLENTSPSLFAVVAALDSSERYLSELRSLAPP